MGKMAHHAKKWAHHAKRWMKKHMPSFDKDMFESWWGNDDESYEEEPRETIWLDSPEDDDDYEIINAEDDSKASHCPITMIK